MSESVKETQSQSFIENSVSKPNLQLPVPA
jgi:hypothetical protein